MVDHISQLKFDKRNPRKRTQRNLKIITDSLQEVGAARSIVIDEDDSILAGNGVVKAAALAGIEKVIEIEADGDTIIAVRRRGLTEEQRQKLKYYDNRSAMLADWDIEVILADMESGLDLSQLWQGDELAAMLEEAGTELLKGTGNGKDTAPQTDKAKELQDLWGTEVGQVWQLGEHRLAVGDCTDKAVVEAVMRGEVASLMVTDPPYNMGSETSLFAQDAPTHYRSTNTLAKADWDKDFDLSQFLKNSLAVLSTDATVYVFTSHFLIQAIWDWMKEWTKFYSYCVWCKPNPSPSLAKRHWTWATELVAYGVRGRHTFNYPDGTHALNWWDITMPRHTTEHPTEKPLSVVCKPIGISSKPGDIVADLFLGSGTTLVACQNLSRKCRAIEVDPGYAAISIQRWVDLTSQQPTRLTG